MDHHSHQAAKLATRLAFLVAGFGIACWAPLIPLAKQRLAVDEGVLGILLLCLGIGSMCAMAVTGLVSSRLGSKPIIIAGGLGMALALPLLSVVDSPIVMGAVLFVFGASLGGMDVAMNVHAVEVEQASERPLMSGFHGLFSVGGFIGAGIITLLLSLQVSALLSCLVSAAAMILATLFAAPRFIAVKPEASASAFVLPRGIVLILSVLAGIVFLVEGAILDWGALLITETQITDDSYAGTGFMLFAIAMTIGRFSGDAITHKIGDFAVLFWGGLIAIAGFSLLLFSSAVPAMAGFFLIGLGASNIVPVLFRRAGHQTIMPPAVAVAAIGSIGYAGILIGPAGIGAIADYFDLWTAFLLLALLLVSVPFYARRVAYALQ